MAKLMVYSVYDAQLKFFDRPMFMRNRGEAMRAWEQAANDEKTTISQHATHFSLMELGSFDEETGFIEQHKTPESLGLAVQFKKTENQPHLKGI